MDEAFKPVKTGIIGCGSIGNVHAEQYDETPLAELRTVCDLLPDKAEAVRAKFGAYRSCVDYRELLADPDIEAVSVCLPNDLHHPVTLAALEAGKHVLCEKPVALNLAQATAMRDAARKHGKKLSIGVVNRFNAHVNLLRDFIREGKMGEIYHVLAMFKNYRSIPGLGGWFTTRARAGGGVMIDWGVHFLDLVLYCLDFPKLTTLSGAAHCRLAAKPGEYAFLTMWGGKGDRDGVCDVEEYASGMARTDRGVSLAFEGAWAQNVGEAQMYIEFLGDKGGARLHYGGAFTWWHDEGGVLCKTEPSIQAPSMFLAEIEDFCRSIRTGAASRADIDTVLDTQALLDAFYRSDAEKREVAVFG